MKNYYLILLALFLFGNVKAQDFLMMNGSVTTCSGNFYDSGGATGNYVSNSNLTYTIYPNTAGANVRVTFTMLNIESCCDYLNIYNGTSTAAPLIGTYNGTTTPPAITANNPNGALTFHFTSDISVNPAGWAATISCSMPCQTITPSIVSTNPAPDPDGIIRLCQGETVNFVGASTFSSTGVGAVYTWYFGDGTTATGTNVSKAYPEGGGYSASLSVSVEGCTGASPERIIQVSTTPNITTSASPQALCDHRNSALYGIATPTTFEQNCTPPISGVTFLPDGGGVNYETSIQADCYPMNASITAGTDILSICMTIEHSFLGDLSMRLRCPNGLFITLKDQGNGGTFLGDPIDDVTSGPGIGWEYCFTPTATVLLTNAPTIIAPYENGASITPGNYLPTQSFDGLIGCPLNGAWTIEITDHLNQDDGYIFEWGITLAENLSNVEAFTPTIVSQGWLPATTLTSISGHNANAFPTTMGAHCYIYQVEDNFGCTYQEEICLDVYCTTLGGEITNFEAQKNENHSVDLSWMVTREYNVLHYAVERMDENHNWILIGTVEGNTNAQESNTYGFVDYQPSTGENYYRIKQVDNQGGFTFSEVKRLKMEKGIFVFPNPAKSQITLSELPEGVTHIELYDSMGKLLMYSTEQQMDVSHLSPGVYHVKAGSDLLRFIKQ